MTTALVHSEIPGMEPRRGKVRDVYDFGDRLLFVATDRMSAFDWVLPDGIPDKGRILTQMSLFWFELLDVSHHLISDSLEGLTLPQGTDVDSLTGRSMVVSKAEVIPFECVVRGYLAGSGWKEYQASGTVCGISLPAGLQQSDRLPETIFTPATKADQGHDENVSLEYMQQHAGADLTDRLKTLSLSIYEQAASYARDRGIIIADTKFEFGRVGDELLLVDEVLTPDSSRFWPADSWQPGGSPPSYDKQFVRDWLESTDWDKNSTPPRMPEEIALRTRDKYLEAFRVLTGRDFE